VSVAVAGDALTEDLEDMRVVLSTPSPGWSIGRSWGLGTIRDAEPEPIGEVTAADVRIGNATIVEGDTGSRNRVKLWLTLPKAPEQPVQFRYTVGSADATPGADFVESTRVVTFKPGQTRRAVTVYVLPDTASERSEVIRIAQTDVPSGPAGFVTILDDD
jgi:hypothetical protein